MRTVSRKRAVALRLYARQRLAFLEANPKCGRCGERAFQVHHRAGRMGAALLDEARWMPVCDSCHRWIGERPAEAIAAGFSLPRVGTGDVA